MAEKSSRDYEREYKTYHKSKLQKKRRAQRNKSNRLARKLGLISKGDKKDVNHIKRNKKGNLDTSRSNISIQSRKKNRSNNQ
tara:strand:- start:1739 stop:1984 length:246 start_codon:yes stop_codon:yes gene_type:complete